MRPLKILGGVIAAILVVAVLLLITGIPLGFLSSTIEDRIAHDTGYRVKIAGSTRVSLWPSLHVAMTELTLEAPNDSNEGIGSRIAIGSIEASMTLGSLWSGKPDVSELVINHPVISVPLLRRRLPTARPATPKQTASPGAAGANAPRIGRITVTDGEVTMSNPRDHVEQHIERIGLHAAIGDDRRVNMTGNARAGGHPLAFDIKATVPDRTLERQTIPLELSLDAPDFLRARLSSKADVRLNGTLVMINNLSGMIGNGAFDGWASIDLASKPLVKLDLDFRQLDLAAAPSSPGPAGAMQPAPGPQASPGWSGDPIDLTGLNYVDAQLRLSASELNIGQAHFSSAEMDATIENGLLRCAVRNLGAYEGLANGEIDIDASRGVPAYTIRSDLTGVRALPLLRSAADFDKLDGKLQAKIDVRSEGQNQRAIMSNVTGTASAVFRDGAIRGLNVAQMIRSLTSGTLSGWQESREQSTDLTQLSASFRIDKGQAATSDLDLVGPLVKMTGAGTIDLGSRTLALRVEPKLVMTTEGQGRPSDPVAFGIPVAIEGPWAEPRIYPDVAGILDNPAAAYQHLQELGQGLFAPGAPGGSAAGSNGQSGPLGNLGETLGNLLQQGLNGGQNNNAKPAAPAQNDPAQGGQNSGQNSRPMNDVLKQLFGR